METIGSSGFVPISPNPFVVGNPIRGRNMFFGRESEFEMVRKRFHGQDRGSLLVFCGERRSGKTSILFQIMDGRLGPDFIPVLIDMQSMAVDDEGQFLQRMADEIRMATGLPSEGHELRFGEQGNRAGVFREFVKGVLRKLPGRKLVLLFDEYELFENKIDAGVLSPDSLRVLASLMEHESVFFVFTGSNHLEDRRRDYWSVLGKSLFRRISYLEPGDALNLIRRPVEGRVQYGPGVVEAIYRLTAGQPFYTQAICQNLVDRLNDERTSAASSERLAEVTRDMVENPLPQMIFLWDGLEPDDKLVFAVLAEGLDSPAARASARDLEQLIGKREYPLGDLLPRIAPVLEKLFKSEMLLKDEETGAPRYAFRMDLWRLWIRRMHSVWQVVRELGIAIPPRPVPVWRRPVAIAAAVPVLILLVAVTWRLTSTSPAGPGDPAGRAGRAAGWLRVVASPSSAWISFGGNRVGLGRYQARLAAGMRDSVLVSAPGYADSTLPFRVVRSETSFVRVKLRPLLGDLEVVTDPAGAEVSVDGVVRGRAPVLVRSLPVPASHAVESRFDGGATVSQVSTISHGRTTTVRLRHDDQEAPPTTPTSAALARLLVTTTPSGAEVLLEGRPAGITPRQFEGLPVGPARIAIRLHDFEPADTLLPLTPGANTLSRALTPVPPGILIVQGDRVGSIFVDERLVMPNTQNSRPVEVRPGTHQVLVRLLTGDQVDTVLSVGSRERVVFDYSSRSVRRSQP